MNRPILSRDAEVNGLASRIAFAAEPHVDRVLAAIGRTEDIRFSPDGSRMAIAGFGRSACYVFDLSIDVNPAVPRIRITDHVEIRSDAVKRPHGLDFIGNDILAVADRAGFLSLFRLPLSGTGQRQVRLKPLRTVTRASVFHKLRHPGSVCVSGVAGNRVELLVCNNYRNRVSRHRVGIGGVPWPAASHVLLTNGLKIPDGIAVDPTGSWIAVSCHETHEVVVYDRRRKLGSGVAPAGRLRGVNYPHGLRFSPDGTALFVADAGSPMIHLFQAPGSDWGTDSDASLRIRVLDDETYMRGRQNPAEGGPKGLDLAAAGSILAITCEEQALAFFDLRDVRAAG